MNTGCVIECVSFGVLNAGWVTECVNLGVVAVIVFSCVCDGISAIVSV